MSTRTAPSLPSARRNAIGLAATVGIAVVLARANLYTAVDDAFISARYAEHAAAGHGLVYNGGQAAIEGYTNWLWTLWLVVAHLVGTPFHEFAVLSGLVGAIVALPGVWLLAGRLSNRPGHPLLLLAPLLLALSVPAALSSTNGLETSWYWALVVWSGWAALSTRRAPTRLGAGLLMFLLGAIRPEGMLVAAIWAFHEAWWGPPEKRPFSPLLLGWALPTTALFAWRYTTYGEWIPNTFYAKTSAGFMSLLPSNLAYIQLDGPTWFLTVGLAVIAALFPPVRAVRVVVFAVALVHLFIALQIELWMPGARLMIPVLAMAAALVAARLADTNQRIPAALLALGAAGLLFTPLHQQARRYDRIHSVLPNSPAAQMAQFIARHAPPGSSLAIRDAGVVAYWSGTEIAVAELHNRALTQPHPGGVDTRLRDHVPPNPTFVLLTQAREHANGIRYWNDKRVFSQLTKPYRYLGRVYQHHHRYYDVYVAQDADFPDLPERLVSNFLGPAGPSGLPR